MGLYASYQPIFAAVKTKLAAVASIKQVITEERFTVSDLPLVVVNMDDTPIERLTISKTAKRLALNVGFSTIVFVQETEPTDWLTDIIAIMCDVFDAITADTSLNDAVLDVWPTLFTPGEAYIKDRLYFGGIIRWQALIHHLTP